MKPPIRIVTLFVLALSLANAGSAASVRVQGVGDVSLQYMRSAGKVGDDSLRSYVQAVLKSNNDTLIVRYGRELHDLGVRHRDERNTIFGAAIAGMGYLGLGAADSSYFYLSKAVSLGENAGDDWALASAYNGMGLYAANVDTDYYRAIPFFLKGMEAARRSGNDDTYSVLLSNMALMYYFRNDPDGFPYALECYELGLQRENDFMVFLGAYMLSSIHYLKKDYGTALEYIEKAEKIILADKTGRIARPSNVVITYNLHGDLLLKLDDEKGAQTYYDKALGYTDQSHAADIVGTYLSYGRYYMHKRDYTRALRMFQHGVRIADSTRNHVHLNQLYREMSASYEHLGDSHSALSYNRKYYQLADSIFNVEKERSLNELKVKYELEKRENEIQQNKLKLLRQERRMQVLSLVTAIILIALLGSWYMYRRKNKLYLEIVKQNQETIRARRRLSDERRKQRLDEASGKYTYSPLSNEKGQELFNELEHLMESEKVYKDKDITVDKLAEALNTNRSYLSRTINEYAGLNFNNYVNKYRINEAVQVLSDVDNDIPLKALAYDLGFNSLSPFYKSFQRDIGMPPSKYREKVVELSRKLR